MLPLRGESPGGTAPLISHGGLDMTRNQETNGICASVMAREKGGDGSTGELCRELVRIDDMTITDKERERTYHPQSELSQRQVLSESDVRIYSTPVKDTEMERCRIMDVGRLSSREHVLSREYEKQKDSTMRPRNDSEVCPTYPLNMLTSGGAKKNGGTSESDHTLKDDSEVWPRLTTRHVKDKHPDSYAS